MKVKLSNLKNQNKEISNEKSDRMSFRDVKENQMQRFMESFFDLRNEFDDIFRWWPNLIADDSEHLIGVGASLNRLFEDRDSYLLKVDCLGLEKENVKIELEGNELKIYGERERKTNDGGCLTNSYKKITRSFRLPKKIDADKLEARLENGILNIVMPKLAEEKSNVQRIAIK